MTYIPFIIYTVVVYSAHVAVLFLISGDFQIDLRND